ncbi:MAG TPA: hypothetical protein VKK79_26365 [Candidatus Lokiarchaeia archaeon]|nr:hypothetical protein [Candidatus Lokiarchaeia archaeon]
MTRSSRRKDAELGHLHDFQATSEKCEACRGHLVQIGKNTYVCVNCGLEQERDQERHCPPSEE